MANLENNLSGKSAGKGNDGDALTSRQAIVDGLRDELQTQLSQSCSDANNRSKLGYALNEYVLDPVKKFGSQVIGKFTGTSEYQTENERIQSLRDDASYIQRIKHAGLQNMSATEFKAVIDLTKKDLGRQKKESEATSEHLTYATGAAKAVGLFARGKLGLGLTTLSFAADEMKAGSSDVIKNLKDGGQGIAKGLATKAVFSLVSTEKLGGIMKANKYLAPLEKAKVQVALSGVTLGSMSRLTELGLTRSNYADGNGKVTADSIKAGVSNIVKQSLDPNALKTDVIVFGLAHGMHRGLNKSLAGAIDKSPMLTTMATGGTFGASNGALAEIARQNEQGRSGANLDWAQVVKRSLTQASVDMAASSVGGLQADRVLRARIGEGVRAQYESGTKNFVAAGDKLVAKIDGKLASSGIKSSLNGVVDTNLANLGIGRQFKPAYALAMVADSGLSGGKSGNIRDNIHFMEAPKESSGKINGDVQAKPADNMQTMSVEEIKAQERQAKKVEQFEKFQLASFESTLRKVNPNQSKTVEDFARAAFDLAKVAPAKFSERISTITKPLASFPESLPAGLLSRSFVDLAVSHAQGHSFKASADELVNAFKLMKKAGLDNDLKTYMDRTDTSNPSKGVFTLNRNPMRDFFVALIGAVNYEGNSNQQNKYNFEVKRTLEGVVQERNALKLAEEQKIADAKLAKQIEESKKQAEQESQKVKEAAKSITENTATDEQITAVVKFAEYGRLKYAEPDVVEGVMKAIASEKIDANRVLQKDSIKEIISQLSPTELAKFFSNYGRDTRISHPQWLMDMYSADSAGDSQGRRPARPPFLSRPESGPGVIERRLDLLHWVDFEFPREAAINLLKLGSADVHKLEVISNTYNGVVDPKFAGKPNFNRTSQEPIREKLAEAASKVCDLEAFQYVVKLVDAKFVDQAKLEVAVQRACGDYGKDKSAYTLALSRVNAEKACGDYGKQLTADIMNIVRGGRSRNAAQNIEAKSPAVENVEPSANEPNLNALKQMTDGFLRDHSDILDGRSLSRLAEILGGGDAGKKIGRIDDFTNPASHRPESYAYEPAKRSEAYAKQIDGLREYLDAKGVKPVDTPSAMPSGANKVGQKGWQKANPTQPKQAEAPGSTASSDKSAGSAAPKQQKADKAVGAEAYNQLLNKFGNKHGDKYVQPTAVAPEQDSNALSEDAAKQAKRAAKAEKKAARERDRKDRREDRWN